jgi:phosphoribosylamine-glycine ligase
VTDVLCAPGNAGIAGVAKLLPIGPGDVTALANLAERDAIDLTIAGPELPLDLGIADLFRSRGLRLFGPSRAAARLECSKVFAKDFMARLAPDGDPMFTHTAEGPDDMSAHVRSVLTHNDLTVPIRNGKIDLGTWQGIYLWEHRQAGYRRSITLTLSGA